MVFIIAKGERHRIDGIIHLVFTARRDNRFLDIVGTRHEIPERRAAALRGIADAVFVQLNISDIITAAG